MSQSFYTHLRATLTIGETLHKTNRRTNYTFQGWEQDGRLILYPQELSANLQTSKEYLKTY